MRTLLAPFFLIFASLIGVVGAYIGLRLAEGHLQWGGILVIACLLLLFPLVHWKSREPAQYFPSWLFSGLQVLGYISMGLMSWLLVVAVARDLFLLSAYLLADKQLLSAVASATKGFPALFVAGTFTLLGAFRAFRGLVVKEVSVQIEGLPPALHGYRIAQISDLHIGPTIGRRYVQNVVNLIEELRPDLTVLTGDIVDGSVPLLREHSAPLSKLVPAGKVFLSPGNHDYYSGFPAWHAEFQRLGLKVLLNEGTLVGHGESEVWVGGVTDPVATQKPDAARAMQGGEGAGFKLLLSHRPELAESAEVAGFQLQLSGHTHGGQFFPWTYVAKRFHQFYLGLMKQKGMWIYVSPGTGSWGPPVRMGTTPEISLIKLVGN